MKVFSMSQRIYYKDLEPDAESIIKKDLELYNCMLHKASPPVLSDSIILYSERV